jgi:reactive intermediate/imine deaminase
MFQRFGASVAALFLFAAMPSAQSIQRINPPGLSAPTTYSHIVRADGIVYIAGQVGADAQGKVVGPGMKEQVEQVLKNLLIALRSQKLDFSHVVKINTYVTDMDAFRAPDVAAIRAQYFGTNRPASTLVGVTRLASPDYKVEIEAIAHVPPGIMKLQQ